MCRRIIMHISKNRFSFPAATLVGTIPLSLNLSTEHKTKHSVHCVRDDEEGQNTLQDRVYLRTHSNDHSKTGVEVITFMNMLH